MKTLQLFNNIELNLHTGRIGISLSGGADSTILLYLLMKYSRGPIMIYTCASDARRRRSGFHALQVIDKCIELGYDAEIDLRIKNGRPHLGHDEPQYEINKQCLLNKKLWCHAKNLDALTALKKIKSHFFWHEKDQYTITSKGFIWTYPGKKFSKESIVVLPEIFSEKKKFNCRGICSDYIFNYISLK